MWALLPAALHTLLLFWGGYLDFYSSVFLTTTFGGIVCHGHALSICDNINTVIAYGTLNE